MSWMHLFSSFVRKQRICLSSKQQFFLSWINKVFQKHKFRKKNINYWHRVNFSQTTGERLASVVPSWIIETLGLGVQRLGGGGGVEWLGRRGRVGRAGREGSQPPGRSGDALGWVGCKDWVGEWGRWFGVELSRLRTALSTIKFSPQNILVNCTLRHWLGLGL